VTHMFRTERLVVATIMFVMLATSAFSVAARTRSGGCCCDPPVYAPEMGCGGPDACEEYMDCCFSAQCFG
jgi:hypothetical protein